MSCKVTTFLWVAKMKSIGELSPSSSHLERCKWTTPRICSPPVFLILGPVIKEQITWTLRQAVLGQSWKSFLRGRTHRSGAFEAQEEFISSRINWQWWQWQWCLREQGDAANSVSVLCVKARSHQDKMKPGGLSEAVGTSFGYYYGPDIFISYLHTNPFNFQNIHKKSPIW